MIDINELRQLAHRYVGMTAWSPTSPKELIEILERLEAAEKDVALKEQVIDALGSELNAVANERDALRTALTALLNDLEERAKWNLEESQRVVTCGNGVYVRAKAALEKSK